jgi:predicted nucleotidyltransferase
LRIADLTTDLHESLGGRAGVAAVYLFGSATGAARPNDVDLVLVYEPPLSGRSVSQLRPLVEATVARTCGLSADIMFFSREEAEGRLLADLQPCLLLAPGV